MLLNLLCRDSASLDYYDAQVTGLASQRTPVHSDISRSAKPRRTSHQFYSDHLCTSPVLLLLILLLIALHHYPCHLIALPPSSLLPPYHLNHHISLHTYRSLLHYPFQDVYGSSSSSQLPDCLCTLAVIARQPTPSLLSPFP